MIYFIQQGNHLGPVKIGYSRTAPGVLSRLSSLQTASPTQLTLIAVITGSEAREAEIHDSFRKFHIRGEWYRWMPPIKLFIDISKDRGLDHSPEVSQGSSKLIRTKTKQSTLDKEVRVKEINLIKDALKTNAGILQESAAFLNMSERAFRYCLNKYNLIGFMLNQQKPQQFVDNTTIKIINAED